MNELARAAVLQAFASPAAVVLLWERATGRCDCFNPRTRQPEWGHARCGGYGVLYDQPRQVRGLFRSQSRWRVMHMQGTLNLAQAQLTTLAVARAGMVAWKPAYTDDRVRDRITVPAADGDLEQGRIWLPTSEPAPYVFGGETFAWRVGLVSLEQAQRAIPQP